MKNAERAKQAGRAGRAEHAKNIVLGITGASGARYARRLAQILIEAGCRVHAIVSPHGAGMLRLELGARGAEPRDLLGLGAARLVFHDYADLADELASGSVPSDGMAVCPCSGNTLAAVAAGLADNLITRAAQVHLKQRRRLVLVPREMPASAIDLENQARLARAGAIIAPACPGFYLRPATLEDLVDFVAARVAQCLGVAHHLDVRYRREGATAETSGAGKKKQKKQDEPRRRRKRSGRS